ncbi:MAG: hypothetical protein HY663_03270 [Chloroflexi bacterium]|nr:hypothetical protein [Chloroflexota bacterium]
MNLQDFLSQGLSLVGTFNLKIALFLFLVNLIGEAVVISIPYLLETTWLAVGYQFSKGVLPFLDLMLLALMAQLGRQGGALALYYLSRSGRSLLIKYQSRFKLKTDLSAALPVKLLHRINILSPFSVALGRLLWLRIPLTLILGAQRKLKVLILGVSLSSLVYDGIYIAFGAIVGTATVLVPTHLVLYSLAGLTVIYGLTFAIRRVIGGLASKRKEVTSEIS